VKFKDHFSKQASEYAKFRPHYPPELFAFIAANYPNHELALDCATGNGQAALLLAEWFGKVIALDASAAQINNAQPNERVEYRIAPAEETSLQENSCDVNTVAQALHWYDIDRFNSEVRRLLRPNGILAVWTYYELAVGPEIKAIVRYYHDEVVGPYWPPERKLVGPAYLGLPFPFVEIESPPFAAQVWWSLEELLGYLGTWSATQRYLDATGRDPREIVARRLTQAWGDDAERLITWPLTVRVGRVNAADQSGN
jgi:SAM-dependent methyltransferase